jgi:hypothetical protein
MEGGANEHVGFTEFTGVIVHVNATVPAKPLVGATAITEVPELPATTENEVGDGVTVMPGTTTFTRTCVVETVAPLVPVTKTV